MTSIQIVAAQNLLGGKTQDLLDKYGPGPRVHYHIGLFADGVKNPGFTDVQTIRKSIVSAQEKMLYRCAEIWEAPRALSGQVVDVGCGLGGGSIFWAQEFGAHVRAVTNVDEHVPVIRRLSTAAGVRDRVEVVLSDATEIPTDLRVDAAVAMESLSYMPRYQVFKRLAKIVRPNGSLCVEDAFLSHEDWREPFDDYWKTSVGTVAEYVDAARDAGFVLDRVENVTSETTEFWIQSMAWIDAVARTTGQSAKDRERLRRSLHWHANFHRAWRDGGMETRILRFRLAESGR